MQAHFLEEGLRLSTSLQNCLTLHTGPRQWSLVLPGEVISSSFWTSVDTHVLMCGLIEI